MLIRKRIPTINDLAALAGVSKKTVSRVINNSDKVNAKTRDKVQAVIKQLDYAPNRQARGLASSRSYLIGVVYDVPTLFVSEIQRGMLDVCADAGYELVVHVCDVHSEKLVDNVTRFVRQTKVDGVIILSPVSQLDELATALEQIDCKYVRFTSVMNDDPTRLVITDYVEAVNDLVDHLTGLGHRNIGFISGPKKNSCSTMRQKAFEAALRKRGLDLPEHRIVEGQFTYDSGVLAARRLLALDDRPTAIFAANDEMAFAVMNVAHEMGLQIPEDLSVAGFDGSLYCEWMIPSLTTIERKVHWMVELGTHKLLSLINEGEDGARKFDTLVSPQFVPGESTGPAPL